MVVIVEAAVGFAAITVSPFLIYICNTYLVSGPCVQNLSKWFGWIYYIKSILLQIQQNQEIVCLKVIGHSNQLTSQEDIGNSLEEVSVNNNVTFDITPFNPEQNLSVLPKLFFFGIGKLEQGDFCWYCFFCSSLYKQASISLRYFSACFIYVNQRRFQGKKSIRIRSWIM